tara:strand:- start:535 stop:729 length:195 start_codon:yes stop_codon:yes gene_type:complete
LSGTKEPLVRDRVEYAVWGGSLINRLLVRPDLDRIFSYRFEKREELFPPAPGKGSAPRSEEVWN